MERSSLVGWFVIVFRNGLVERSSGVGWLAIRGAVIISWMARDLCPGWLVETRLHTPSRAITSLLTAGALSLLTAGALSFLAGRAPSLLIAGAPSKPSHSRSTQLSHSMSAKPPHSRRVKSYHRRAQLRQVFFIISGPVTIRGC